MTLPQHFIDIPIIDEKTTEITVPKDKAFIRANTQ